MSRLIDADALDRMGYVLTRTYQQDKKTMVYETKKLSDVPSVQPERKRGKWIRKGCGCFECDQCGKLVASNVYTDEKISDRFKFCPNCGADMREGEQS